MPLSDLWSSVQRDGSSMASVGCLCGLFLMSPLFLKQPGTMSCHSCDALTFLRPVVPAPQASPNTVRLEQLCAEQVLIPVDTPWVFTTMVVMHRGVTNGGIKSLRTISGYKWLVVEHNQVVEMICFFRSSHHQEAVI